MTWSSPRHPTPGQIAGQRRARRVDPDLTDPHPELPPRRGDYAKPLERIAAKCQAALVGLVHLLVPSECICCGIEDTELCSSCARRIRMLCRVPFRAEQQSTFLLDFDGSAKLGVVAAGAYRDDLSQAILSFKSRGQGRLAAVLGPCLGRAVKAAVGRENGLYLIPVPSSGKAFRRRGFSPVHVLLAEIRRRRMLADCPSLDALRRTGIALGGHSKGAAGTAGAGLLAAVVQTIAGQAAGRAAGGQKGLARGERGKRVAGSMAVRRRFRSSIQGRKCLLVDDVLTTGATLAEAARAVAAAGGTVCGAVVLAATRPPAYASSDACHEPGEVVKTQTKNKWLKGE